VEGFVNPFWNCLELPVGTTDTTITLANTAPIEALSGDSFRLQIENELLIGTSIEGKVVTVQRGQEGTIASAHAQGVSVTNPITAGALVQLRIDAVTAAQSTSPVQFQFTYQTVSPYLLQAVSVGSYVIRAAVVITVAFNDPDAFVELGTSGQPNLVLGSGDSYLSSTGTYNSENITIFNTSEQLLLTLSPGSSTLGSGILYYWIKS
jgi:hypothetical protein